MNLRLVDWTDDDLGRRCLEERARIRRMFADAHRAVAQWEPRPMPANYRKQVTQ